MSPYVSCECFSSPRSDVDEMDFTRPILPHCPILILYIFVSLFFFYHFHDRQLFFFPLYLETTLLRIEKCFNVSLILSRANIPYKEAGNG